MADVTNSHKLGGLKHYTSHKVFNGYNCQVQEEVVVQILKGYNIYHLEM